MNASTLVQKLWNFCNTLRDDGVGYGDYLEQLTYLLFLKLAHEYAQEPYNHATKIPKGYDWSSLSSKNWRAVRGALPFYSAQTGAGAGYAGGYLLQGTEQDPRSSQALSFGSTH
ncbi:hypothetical protein DZJ_25930 [Dickeya ananatis]